MCQCYCLADSKMKLCWFCLTTFLLLPWLSPVFISFLSSLRFSLIVLIIELFWMLETLTLTTISWLLDPHLILLLTDFLLTSVVLLHKKEGPSNHVFIWFLFLESSLLRHHLLDYYYVQHAWDFYGLLSTQLDLQQIPWIDKHHCWYTLKTTLLSVQNISSSTWMFSSLFSIFEILTDSIAAVNSSLEIETIFKGPTLDFSISWVQWVWPFSLSNLI